MRRRHVVKLTTSVTEMWTGVRDNELFVEGEFDAQNAGDTVTIFRPVGRGEKVNFRAEDWPRLRAAVDEIVAGLKKEKEAC